MKEGVVGTILFLLLCLFFVEICFFVFWEDQFTLPETNIAPKKWWFPTGISWNLLFQGSIFRFYVSFKGGTYIIINGGL